MQISAHSWPGRLVPILKGYGLGRGKIQMITRKIIGLLKHKGARGTLLYLKALSARFKSWYSKGDIPSEGTWVDFRWWKRLVRKNRKLVRMCMAIHRVITLKVLTLEQWVKFDMASRREQPDHFALAQAHAYVRLGSETLGHLRDHDPHSVWLLYMEKELAASGGDLPAAQRSAVSRMAKDLLHLKHHGLLNEDYSSCYEPFAPIDVFEYASRLKLRNPSTTDLVPVGSLNVSQEPGGKARFFASPRLIYQARLGGVFTALDELLYELPEDACHDQTGPLRAIEEQLQQGKTVYSVDLSSATDNFPLSLQLAVARRLGIRSSDIECIEHLSTSPWSVSKDISDHVECAPYHRWTVGQPLGMKPSFALFSATMHALIRGIAVAHRLPYSQSYYQLGDDHVGFVPELEERLISVLKSIGVPVSAEKSITSDRCAEFGGALIRKDGFTFRPGKWRSLANSTALSYCADPDFDPSRVWPPTVVSLVEKLRSRPWPFGFVVTDPSDLSTPLYIEGLRRLTRNALLPYDTTRFALERSLSDVTLFKHIDQTRRYHQLEFHDHLLRQRHLAGVTNRMDTKERLFWDRLGCWHGQHVHISDFRPDWLDLEDKRSVQFAELVASAWAGDVKAGKSNPFVWEITLRRRCSTGHQLAGALLSSSPFRTFSQYVAGPEHSFFRVLRRVADYKDVIPTHLFPMPIR